MHPKSAKNGWKSGLISSKMKILKFSKDVHLYQVILHRNPKYHWIPSSHLWDLTPHGRTHGRMHSSSFMIPPMGQDPAGNNYFHSQQVPQVRFIPRVNLNYSVIYLLKAWKGHCTRMYKNMQVSCKHYKILHDDELLLQMMSESSHIFS